MSCEPVEEVLTSDTIRIKGTFRDYAIPPAVGDEIDPDDQEATYTAYDSYGTILETGDCVREALGVYYYDYTTPADPAMITFEIRGLVSTKPQLSRVRLNVKFVLS